MTNFKRFCLLSVAAGAMISWDAYAQGQGNYYSRDKYEAVMERRQPEFDPEPIRLGAFLVDATGIVGVTSNSNVYASALSEESDVITRIGATIAARTDWSVHEIGADLSAFRNEFSDFSDESNSELRAALRGRLDVTRDLKLGASVFTENRTEPRTDPSNANGLQKPIEYTRSGFELQANYLNDRFRWTNAVGITKSDFKDGRQIGTNIVVDQDFRDHDSTTGRSRLSYAVTPNVAVFAQGTMHEESYDSTQLIGGALRSRDSTGYTVAGGFDFELTALVRGDVAVGYMSEDKDDPFFKDVDGLSLDGRVLWFPTRLTTATFTAGRHVQDVGLFASPSVLVTDFGVRVDHELKRNIILSGTYRNSNYDFQELSRTDDVNEFGASVIYKMNKRIHLEGFARRMDRDASGSALTFDPSYGVDLFGVQLSLHP
ncbi:MAG: outer membrane beta-barrel protein [Hyphomonas sp.]